MDTGNGRQRLQHSAAAWQARADMLQRIATSFAKRKALDDAERERATGREAPEPHAARDG